MAGVGFFHLLFASGNLAFAQDCSGSVFSFRSCMVFYEGVFSAVAGVALVGGSGLVVARRGLAAALVVLAGTVPLTLFFWLAAIPSGLSSRDFGIGTLPVPTVAALAAVFAFVRRRRRDSRTE